MSILSLILLFSCLFFRRSSPEVIDKLADLMMSDNVEIKRQAIYLIGQIGLKASNPKIVNNFVKLLKMIVCKQKQWQYEKSYLTTFFSRDRLSTKLLSSTDSQNNVSSKKEDISENECKVM